MEARGVGIDLVDIARFRELAQDDPFLLKVFTDAERAYCFSHASPAEHFAGIFAAKEAVWKALQDQSFPAYTIQIQHGETGAPQAWKDGKRLPLQVSISHTDTTAAAVAVF